ncbi:hypothetical protein LOZ65_006157 [Ophidiomyces ophidiicola]|nr:hypothetical protein LOZ65_006157 [Ophidiomyces ophidiicola]
MDVRQTDDPFTVEIPRESAFFKIQPLKPLEQFSWNDHFPDLAHGVFREQSRIFIQDETNIFPLNIFGVESSYPLGSTSDPSSPTRTTEGQDDCVDKSSETDDIWELNRISKAATDSRFLRSWDTFPHHKPHTLCPTYLSEAGSAGFDAALVFQASQTGLEDSGRAVQTDIFILSLFQLGLGWSTVFFQFNEQARKFEKSMKDVRISGISLTSLDAFIDELLVCGSQVRHIRKFLASTPDRAGLSPALANFSHVVYVLLYGLENHLFERWQCGPSLLETQILFRRSQCLIKCLTDIIETVKDSVEESDVISAVFLRCENLSHEFLWLTDILHEILAVTAGTWLSRTAKLIGLPTPGVTCSDRTHSQDSPFHIESGAALMDAGTVSNLTSGVVSYDQTEIISECAKSLCFLRTFHPDHPLARKMGLQSSTCISLECAFTWDDMDRIQDKANAYEASLRVDILKYSHGRESSTQNLPDLVKPLHKDEAKDSTINKIFQLTYLKFGPCESKLDGKDSASSCKLYHLVSNSPCVDARKGLGIELPLGPPLLSALGLSFIPILSAQTRLINFSCLHLLFKKHKLKMHLRLLWRFQLVGDGAFLSRLSTTLFDPNMQSGERKAGVARGGTNTGLRLGNRDTWPPASSELRLVLMGMLAECHAEYLGTDSKRSETLKVNKDLPGGLSFSIRDLSDDELVKCKDPNSLEALDFLCLQYTTPPALKDAITLRSLRKYDRIFKHLLRLIRLLATVRSLIRSSQGRTLGSAMPHEQRFSYEAFHFVQAVSEYCFHTCVSEAWHRFEKTLSKIDKCIDDGDIDGTIDHAKSVYRLRDYHEDVLEQILFAMLLSKKHEQAKASLEGIFGTILSFAQHLKPDNDNARLPRSSGRSTQELFVLFRRQVKGFVRFLKSIGRVQSIRRKARYDDLETWGAGQADASTNCIFDHLLLKLDMTEFY